MTLRELRYLVAVADHGHFGRAAAACHVSQPTLSTQLKKLEDYLGGPLLERGGRGVELTLLGRQTLAHARRILQEAEQLVAGARTHQAPLCGPLKLGIIPTLSPYFLPWLLPAMRARYAELRPVVHEDLTQVLLERLRDRQIEAAIVALPLETAEFETAALFDEPFWLACPRTHALAARRRIDIHELQDEPLLLLTDGHCLRGQALEVCGRPQTASFGDFRATSLETLCQLVAGGLGCTLLPALAVPQQQNAIAIRPLAAPRASRRIGLVWRRHCPRGAEFRLLAQLVAVQPPRGTRRVAAQGRPRRAVAAEIPAEAL